MINQGKAATAKLDTKALKYKRLTDAVTGEALDAGKIAVDAHSGRWIRAKK